VNEALSAFEQGILFGGTIGIVVGQTILGLILSLQGDDGREHIDPE
jgi:hypothetical protein